FIPQVKDKPTDRELQELFDRYKDREQASDKPEPGFKQPRRVRIEWVSGQADSPIYRRKAHELLVGLLATTPSTPLVALSPIQALAKEVRKDYDTLTFDPFERTYRLPALTERNFVLPLYTVTSGPENLAAAVGQAAGITGASQGMLPAVLAAVTTHQAGAVAREEKAQAAVL